MKKRDFLKAAAIGITAVPAAALAKTGGVSLSGPAILTLTGAITKTNRGPLDPALDQMMAKQKLKFDKAYAFDFQALDAMPKTRIEPTLEYDEKPHKLSGPLLTDVLQAAGATLTASSRVTLRAIDGYAVAVPSEDLRKYRFIVATRLDDKPIPLGGLGPLWTVYDADRIAEFKAKPVKERFGLCPWGVYHIDVSA